MHFEDRLLCFMELMNLLHWGSFEFILLDFKGRFPMQQRRVFILMFCLLSNTYTKGDAQHDGLAQKFVPDHIANLTNFFVYEFVEFFKSMPSRADDDCNLFLQISSVFSFIIVIDKRKSSTNHSLQQPPFKKMAVDGPTSMMQPIAVTANLQGAEDGFPAQSSSSNIGQPSTSGQVSIETIGGRREKVATRALKGSASLAQAWKEDMDAGTLLSSLFQLFGEGILSFIQPAEASFFL